MFCFSGCKACRILAPQPGIEPVPPALEGGVLTTGPPGKSPLIIFTKGDFTWPVLCRQTCTDTLFLSFCTKTSEMKTFFSQEFEGSSCWFCREQFLQRDSSPAQKAESTGSPWPHPSLLPRGHWQHPGSSPSAPLYMALGCSWVT